VKASPVTNGNAAPSKSGNNSSNSSIGNKKVVGTGKPGANNSNESDIKNTASTGKSGTSGKIVSNSSNKISDNKVNLTNTNINKNKKSEVDIDIIDCYDNGLPSDFDEEAHSPKGGFHASRSKTNEPKTIKVFSCSISKDSQNSNESSKQSVTDSHTGGSAMESLTKTSKNKKKKTKAKAFEKESKQTNVSNKNSDDIFSKIDRNKIKDVYNVTEITYDNCARKETVFHTVFSNKSHHFTDDKRLMFDIKETLFNVITEKHVPGANIDHGLPLCPDKNNTRGIFHLGLDGGLSDSGLICGPDAEIFINTVDECEVIENFTGYKTASGSVLSNRALILVLYLFNRILKVRFQIIEEGRFPILIGQATQALLPIDTLNSRGRFEVSGEYENICSLGGLPAIDTVILGRKIISVTHPDYINAVKAGEYTNTCLLHTKYATANDIGSRAAMWTGDVSHHAFINEN
jgi:hypothetical protein